MADIGFVLGGIVAISVLMIIWRWILSRFFSSHTLILVSTFAALVTATVLGAYGAANGGDPNFVSAFFAYCLPAAIVGLIALGIAYARAGSVK